jgi:restriction endonuclease S subunit
VIRPEALYLYLKSKLGDQMLKSRAAGDTVPAIQAQDLNELPIPAPPKVMQEKWQRAFDDEVEWAKAIQELRAKIAELRDPGFFGA